jgi:hypothetical protein
MRATIAASVIAVGLVVATASTLSVQPFSPLLAGRPAAIPALPGAGASGPATASWTSERAIARLRTVLAERGFEERHVDGPMQAFPPGRLSPGEMATTGPDTDTDALLSMPPDAWLIDTPSGRFWLLRSGLIRSADARAQLFEALATQLIAEGRPIE